MDYFVDAAGASSSAYGETMCSDHFEIARAKDYVIAALSGGAGRGVAACASTMLSTKLLVSMVLGGMLFEEAVWAVASSMQPGDRHRYSPFIAICVSKGAEASVFEFGSPRAILLRRSNPCELEYIKSEYGGVCVREAKFRLAFDDVLIAYSEGMSSAVPNDGWPGENIAVYAGKACKGCATSINLAKLLVCATRELCVGRPLDDFSTIVLRLKRAEYASVLVGGFQKDSPIYGEFLSLTGRKIVCGDRAASALAGALGSALQPAAQSDRLKMERIDLITGDRALVEAAKLISDFCQPEADIGQIIRIKQPDSAARLARALLERPSGVKLYVGEISSDVRSSLEVISDCLRGRGQSVTEEARF